MNLLKLLYLSKIVAAISVIHMPQIETAKDVSLTVKKQEPPRSLQKYPPPPERILAERRKTKRKRLYPLRHVASGISSSAS